MGDLQYEAFISIRARRGNAVTSDLLPRFLVIKTDNLGLALSHIQLSTFDGVDAPHADMSPLAILDLADKVEQDIKNNKYKWQVDVEV